MSKHIPGPWAVCTNPKNPYWKKGITIGSANPSDARRICDLAYAGGDEIREANGRLIAAAPDLLAALKKMLADPSGCPCCDSGKLKPLEPEHWDTCGFHAAEKAIATAEGGAP